MALFGFGKYGTRARMAAVRNLRLRCASREERFGAYALVRGEVAAARMSGDLTPVHRHYAQAVQDNAHLPSGSSLAAAIVQWTLGPAGGEPIAAQHRLEVFARDYDRRPGALSAGLYAIALLAAAFAAGTVRGPSGYAQRARTVLDESVVAGHEDWAWNYANTMVSYHDGSSRIVADTAFRALLALNPTDATTIGTRMLHLSDPEFAMIPAEADLFARDMVTRTREQLGSGAYALAYGVLPLSESITVEETSFDADLARAGFTDMIARTSGVTMLNVFARTMSWADEESTVMALFAGGLRVLDPLVWANDENDVKAIYRATGAYVVAAAATAERDW